MADALEIVSLGGSGGFGTNATLFLWEREGLLVDFGVGFPRGVPCGASRVVPDAAPLISRCDRLHGIFLTHSHDDHAAALPYLPLEWADAPVHGSAFAVAAALERFRESRRAKPPTRVIDEGEAVAAGPFRVTALRVTHSAPQSRALAIETPVGTVLHSGDFKLDRAPYLGEPMDLAPFAELAGRGGVRALLVDSTGVLKPGRAREESAVRPALAEQIARIEGQVLVSTFSSQLERIAAVLSVAEELDRQVGVVGQRMVRTLRLAQDLGLLQLPPGRVLDLGELAELPRARRLYLAGGCQGEALSSLGRISYGQHPAVAVEAEDGVILSSSVIPGSEVQVGQLIDRFLRLGCRVVSAWDDSRLHASGHGQRDEIRELVETLRPALLVPVHGDRLHLERVAELADELEVPPEQVLIAERGDVLRVGRLAAELSERIELAPCFLNEADVPVGLEVARDRWRLGEAGAVFVRAHLDGDTIEVRTEAFGIPGWDEEPGASATVERLVRGALAEAGRGADADELEELLARKIANLMRRGARRRPAVSVFVERTDKGARKDVP